jgi:hypothetical protein
MKEGYTRLVRYTGYLLLKMPQEILNEIKISVDEIQKDFTKAIPINNSLAGQIDKEYKTTLTQKATQYIKWTVEQYNQSNPGYVKSIGRLRGNNLNLNYEGDAWVNFQEKYEYNPMHNHTGVFSYVIWYQIPFYRENEIKYGAGKGRNVEDNSNGIFQFLYHIDNEICGWNLNIDKTMEGYIAIFPSNLNHQVNPFYTSDDYRITVSGNIYLQ